MRNRELTETRMMQVLDLIFWMHSSLISQKLYLSLPENCLLLLFS